MADGQPEESVPTAPAAAVAVPQRAAGILLAGPAGDVLLMRRADGQGWAFPGGGIEEGESAEEAARREFEEETGRAYEGKLAAWTRRIRDGVDFTTFLGKVDEAFTPVLNVEHQATVWLAPELALSDLPLHPGARVALARLSMNERGVAEAMAAGDLVSPQRFANMLLVALRITGTGASYRAGLKEYVWRDASLYLNQAFLDRCAGLPVIVEHPDKAVLDSTEYAERTVGAVMFAYLQADEVWAIARIYNSEIAHLLETEQLSTSPGVAFIGKEAGAKFTTEGGATVLIEDEPSLLDHIALCSLGVWDKGGAPAGVKVDTLEHDVRLDAALMALAASHLAALERRAQQLTG